MMLQDWGVDVKYHHHEVGGSGQMEIEVELGDMVDMADKTMIIKYVVHNAAVQDGRTATFMPKPIYKEAGNGMHVHMLLMKDGEPGRGLRGVRTFHPCKVRHVALHQPYE